MTLVFDVILLNFLGYVTLIAGNGFPIHQFFNKSSEIDLSAYLCQSRNPDKCCDCKVTCMIEKTCCIDYLWKNYNASFLTPYLEQFVKESQIYKDLDCNAILPAGFTSESYLMVTTCSHHASEEAIRKCERVVDGSTEILSPVIGSDNYLYKNSHCAECNFVNGFERVNISGICQTQNKDPYGNMSVFQQYTDCKFDIDRAMKYKLVTCMENQTCSKDSVFYDLCKSYKGTIGTYENYHCFRCNTQSSFAETKPYCDPPTTDRKYGWSVTISGRKATVLNLRNDDGDYLKSKQFTVCEGGKEYDVYSGQCKSFVCAPDYHKAGGSCVKRPLPRVVYVENADFEACLLSRQPVLYIKTLTQAINATNLQQLFQQYLNTSNEQLVNHSSTSNQTILKRMKAVTKSDLQKLVHLPNDPHTELWQHIRSMHVTSIREQPLTDSYNFDITRTFPNQRICAKPSSFPAFLVNFTKSCDASINNKTTSWFNTSSQLTITRDQYQQVVSTCKQFHLHSSCKLIKLKENVTIVGNSSLILVTPSKNYSFDINQYVPLAKGYGVCIKAIQPTSTRKWLDIVNDVDYYMALVGCSVGILCYTVIIVTYSFYKELQNLPSLNAMALCTALLLADVSFVVGVETKVNHDMCKFFAICLHWSLMACISWVAIIAFDLSVRFNSVKSMSEGRNFKLFRRYFVLAFSVSTLVVAITVILEQTDAVTVGYGNNGICWIEDYYAKLGAYIIPASVGYVFTVAGLTYTLYTIRQDNNQNRTVLASSGRHNVNLTKIALKLACILGISEGIGFIQIHRTRLSENEELFNSVFTIAYDFARTLRGLLLFFVYICNEKVLSLYKKTITQIKSTKYKTDLSSQKTSNITLNSIA